MLSGTFLHWDIEKNVWNPIVYIRTVRVLTTQTQYNLYVIQMQILFALVFRLCHSHYGIDSETRMRYFLIDVARSIILVFIDLTLFELRKHF